MKVHWIHIFLDTKRGLTICEISDKTKKEFLKSYNKPFYKYIDSYRLDPKHQIDMTLLALKDLQVNDHESVRQRIELLLEIVGQFYLDMASPVVYFGVKFVWIPSDNKDVGYWRALDAPVKIYEIDGDTGKFNPSVHFGDDCEPESCNNLREAFKEASKLVKKFKKDHGIK